MADASACLLCENNALVSMLWEGTAYVECRKCGAYKISHLAARTFERQRNTNAEVRNLLPYLSAYTRQSSERGDDVFLNHENRKDFALAHSNTSVARKLIRLRELIATRSKPGAPAKLDYLTDAPLLDVFDPNELNFLIITLGEVGHITSPATGLVVLTGKGWEQVQSASSTGITGKCFVAMSFDKTLKKEVYDDGIRPAVEDDCKMDAVRIDLVSHNDNIIDKIISEIRTCQFMVADFTGQKGGVYFEAGFAKGLGREVIWTCKEDDFKNIHFDIAQFSHILWKDSHDLRSRLANKIKATIPGAV